MVSQVDDRLNVARELLQVACDEFAKAEETKGRASIIGLREGLAGSAGGHKQLPPDEGRARITASGQ